MSKIHGNYIQDKNTFARLQSGVFYYYTFPKQLSPPKKLFTIYEKSINKSYIYTNNDFIYKNISFILTNISLIYTFRLMVYNFVSRAKELQAEETGYFYRNTSGLEFTKQREPSKKKQGANPFWNLRLVLFRFHPK